MNTTKDLPHTGHVAEASSTNFQSEHLPTSTTQDRTMQVVIRHHTKSRSGCATCKTRRIKCDEAKPVCGRCKKSGFECDGYKPVETRKVKAVSQRPHSKSRSGCITCKARRVKCDEARPTCGWCSKAGQACEYKNPPPVGKFSYDTLIEMRRPLQPKSSNSIPTLRLNLVPGNGREQRCFEFYVTELGPMLAGSFDISFWTQTLIQRSVAEPAIWHTLVALSMLQEQARAQKTDFSKQLTSAALKHHNWAVGGFAITEEKSVDEQQKRQTAIKHYNKAMRSLASLNTRNTAQVETIIMASLVFAIIEVILVDAEKAYLHLNSGVQMIQDWKAANTGVSSPDRFFIEGLLEPMIDHCYNIGHIYHGRTTLDLLQHDVMNFVDTLTPSSFDPTTPEFEQATAQQFIFLEESAKWLPEFEEALARPALIDPRKEEEDGVQLILFRHAMLSIQIKNLLTTNEMDYDEHIPEFEKAITHAEGSLAGIIRRGPKFTTSLLPPIDDIPLLFVLVTKCRDAQIRRRTLDLMRRTNGMFVFQNDDLWNKAAQRIVDVESQGSPELGGLVEGELPSDLSRVYEMKLRHVSGDVEGARKASLLLKQKSRQLPGQWIWREEYVIY